MALHHLVKARWLVMSRSGFYVIVDPQNRSAGTLPPEWFIQELMKDMGRPYYALVPRQKSPKLPIENSLGGTKTRRKGKSAGLDYTYHRPGGGRWFTWKSEWSWH